MKGISCLGLLLSLLLLIVLILGIVFYIAFGPRSIVLGFLFGAGVMLAVAWLGFRYPALLAVADARSMDSRKAGAIVKSVIDASDNPRATAFAIGRVLGWCLTIFFGAATCLFALFAIALRLRGELTSGMTGAAVLCGACLVLALIGYKFIARAGLP